MAIIDDDEEVRLSMGGLLRSYGYESRAFDSAEAFLRSFDETAYACLITDVDMRGMDGIALLELLRSRRSVLPVIVISALDPARTRALAASTGANAFLAKPVDPDELLDWVRRLSAAEPPTGDAQPRRG